LNPLGWLLGLLLSSDLVAIWLKAPTLVVGLLSALVAAAVGFYVYAYFHFMKNDPNALRSERFVLGRLAIEKNVAGDDLAGIIEVVADKTTMSKPVIVAIDDEKGSAQQ
jgi:hypothetical protein